jgi:putative transposase
VNGRPRIRKDNIRPVTAWVEQARQRSGLPVRTVLKRLAIPASSYYRALAGGRTDGCLAASPASARRNARELLPEERMLILDYALTFPDPRHRALAWEMTDTGVVCASPSSVYRVLKVNGLVPRWPVVLTGSAGQPHSERATLPDERWLIDFTYIRVEERWRYLFYLMDEYSRYVVYHELMWRMDQYAVSAGVECALMIPGRVRQPQIQTDNGPAFKSVEFRRYLAQHGIEQRRSRPHCPEDNGVVERGIRTLKELAGDEFDAGAEGEAEIRRAVDYYNRERRHSALYYLRPIDYYRGDPGALLAVRQRLMAAARMERRRVNLRLATESQQLLTKVERVAKDSSNPMPVLSHLA